MTDRRIKRLSVS